MLRYKLITFDVTGTILKFKQPAGVQYAKVASLFGVQADPNALSKSFRKQWRHLNHCKPNFGATHNGWEEWWQEAVQGTFIDAGVTCDKKILHGIAKHLIDKYTTSSCWQPCDGAVELLSKLKYHRIPLGVVSNFDARLNTILENMDVNRYFNFVLTSYAFGYPKPDHRIFDEALRRLNRETPVDPSQILHVGDTAELDCKGAQQAGWNSWLITGNNSNHPAENDHQQNSQVHLAGSIQDLHDHLFRS